jgi:hypothetical protein
MTYSMLGSVGVFVVTLLFVVVVECCKRHALV